MMPPDPNTSRTDEILNAYKAGASVRNLVKQFEVSRYSILQSLKKAGVPIRRATPGRPRLDTETCTQCGARWRAGTKPTRVYG